MWQVPCSLAACKQGSPASVFPVALHVLTALSRGAGPLDLTPPFSVSFFLQRVCWVFRSSKCGSNVVYAHFII